MEGRCRGDRWWEEVQGLGVGAKAGRPATTEILISVSPLCPLPPHVSLPLSWPLCPEGDSRRLKGAIQRSTETGLAVEMPSRTLRQASHESIEDSMNSYGSEGK